MPGFFVYKGFDIPVIRRQTKSKNGKNAAEKITFPKEIEFILFAFKHFAIEKTDSEMALKLIAQLRAIVSKYPNYSNLVVLREQIAKIAVDSKRKEAFLKKLSVKTTKPVFKEV
ncbi:hypothetical protein MHBO_001354 [Bonamia ostreae]|uniref:LAGLIDADG homing endonuclease n=1 Tax=Bonamia ostreae TaxID=126728 RepID=A0ABV2AIT5_9EUKA